MVDNRLIRHFTTKYAEHIGDAVWLDIQNVADYYLNADQEIWDIDRDFPNLAPPWPHFIAAYHHPGRWRSLGKQIDGGEPANVLVLMQASPPPQQSMGAILPPDARWMVNMTV